MASHSQRLAVLFPGQGSQHVGMGRALAESWELCARLMARAEQALAEPLSSWCYQGPEQVLRQTAVTQPAVLTVNLMAWAAWQELGGPLPGWFVGHSLGEYAALVAAGVLSLADAVRVVRRRGELMQQAVPEGQGAMAALLGADGRAAAELCERAAQGQVLEIANFNGAGQVVLSGHAQAVARACGMARELGIRRASRLPVSAPFHCALMAPAAQGLAGELEQVNLADGDTPVLSNVTARPHQPDAQSLRARLVEQVVAPVRWEDSIRWLADEQGVDTFVELGPGKVLGGLVRRIVRGATVVSAGDPLALRAALAKLQPAEG